MKYFGGKKKLPTFAPLSLRNDMQGKQDENIENASLAQLARARDL